MNEFEVVKESVELWATREDLGWDSSNDIVVTTKRAAMWKDGSVDYHNHPKNSYVKFLCSDQWSELTGVDLQPGEECCFKLVFKGLE